MAVAWIIYVIILGYLCAPDVMFTLKFFSKMVKTDEQRAFLHSVIFFLLLVLSLFILLLIRTTFVVTTTTTTTTIVPAPTTTAVQPVFLTSFAYQQPTILPNPPPVPTIAKIPTGSWSWPKVEVVYPGPKPPPASTPLPAFVPPIAPYNKLAAAAAAPQQQSSQPASFAPAPSAGGGGSAAGSPTACQSLSCIPLPPATPAPAPAPSRAPRRTPVAPSWIPALVKIVNRYNSIQFGPKITSTEWVNYFKTSFPTDISEKFVRVEEKADDNSLIEVMRQLTDYKDKKQTQSATRLISGL